MLVGRDHDECMCMKCKTVHPLRNFESIGLCPDCKARLDPVRVNSVRKGGYKYNVFFCVVQNVNGITIIRTFLIKVNYSFIFETEMYQCFEICRHWISDCGESAVSGKPIYWGNIVLSGKIKFRSNHRVLYDYYADTALLYPDPKLSFLFLKNRGYEETNSIPEKNAYSSIMELFEDNIAVDY